MRKRSLPLMLSFFALCLGFSIFQGCGGSSGGGGGCSCLLSGLTPGTRVSFLYFSGNVITLTAAANGTICYPANDQPQPPTEPPRIDCNVPFRVLSSSPPTVSDSDMVNLNSPPSSMTFTGLWGLDTTYGMPIVDYFNDRGYLFSYQSATAVGGDGSWLTVPVPDLSACFSGTYRLRISNKRWDAGYTEAIDVLVTCYGRDRIDADGDGWTSDQDCDDSDPNVNPGALLDCSGLYYDRNCNGIYDYDECNPYGGGCYGTYSSGGNTDEVSPMYIEPIYCY